MFINESIEHKCAYITHKCAYVTHKCAYITHSLTHSLTSRVTMARANNNA